MRSVAAALVASLALAACGGSAGSSAAAAPSPRPTAARDPAAVHYAAGAARYRLDVTTNTVQEVMGSNQEAQFTQSALLSTTLADAGAEMVLAITVDSLTVQGTIPGLDAAALSVARGQTFRARFTPHGLGLGVTVPDSTNAVMLQVGRSFRDFLPRLPAAPLAAGVAWADTVSDTQSMPGGTGQTSTRSVRQHRIVGWEDRDGVRALHLATTGAFEISGTGEAQGQPIEITGAGQATADRWVSAAGQFLGGTSRDSTNLTVTVINAGITVPIRRIQSTSVARLP
jgi:hypothetical protein